MKKAGIIMLFLLSILMAGCDRSVDIEIRRTIEKNETLKTDFFEWSQATMGYREEIEPRAASGYYHHFEKKAGMHYLCIEGKMKNVSNSTMDVRNITGIVELDGEKYEGQMRYETKDGKDLCTEIKEGEELTTYTFFSVPESIKGRPEELILLFDEELHEPKDNRYRYEIRWKQ